MTYIPHIATQFGANLRRLFLRLIGRLRHAEELDQLTLQSGQLGMEDLNGRAALEQRMSLCEAEWAQDLFGGRSLAQALFGVNRQLLDALALHREAQFA